MGRDTASTGVPAYLRRWIGDPNVGALVIAVSCRLRRLRLCQVAAETWLELATRLVHSQETGVLQACNSLREWGQAIASRRKWHELTRDEYGTCLAIAMELSADICVLAEKAELTPSLPAWSDDLVGPLMDWMPGDALRELQELSDASPRSKCPFYVDPDTDDTLSRIDVSSGGEIVLPVNGMRVRPHNFRVGGLTPADRCDPGYRVAQLVEDAWSNRSSGTFVWDTICDENPSFPFWPHAVEGVERPSSHRCSVRVVGGRLEWSDWPQVPLSPTKEIPTGWRFLTGVFRCRDVDHVTHYQLIGRTEWAIDWSKTE